MNTLEEQDNVLNQDKHEIDGRRVEVKIPDSRVSHPLERFFSRGSFLFLQSENFRNPLLPREQSTNKVFVGRLPETTTDELRAFFEAEAKKVCMYDYTSIGRYYFALLNIHFFYKFIM